MMHPASNSLTPRTERLARNSYPNHLFSSDNPNGSFTAGYSTRKRTKSFAMGFDGAADEEPVEKGGHTLRKRSRVDYTQELVNDDLLAHEPKPDASKKPAHTPTTQARKRRATQDLSGDETDNAGIAQKRRRVEKENLTPRSTAARRKGEASRQSAASVQPSFEHPPSDNEVQDTILVGGPMENPDSSSDEKHETSQSEGSQSPEVPHSLPQLADEVPQVPALTAKAVEAPGGLGPAPNNQSVTDNLEEEQRPEVISLDTAGSASTHDATKDRDGKSETQPPAQNNDHAKSVLGPIGSNELPTLKQDSQGPASRPQDEHVPDVATSEPINTKDEEEQAPISKNETAQEPELPVLTTPIESLAPQPKSLPQLTSIYESAQQQVYQPPLVPYEEEEVVHPASWTEKVHPQEALENGISTPAPTITPRPSPPPKEPVYIADSWDPTKPLTHKHFFSLYLEDSRRRKAKGQSRISLHEFRAACARRRKEAIENPKPEPEVPKKPARSKAKGKGKGKGRGRSKRNRTPDSSVDAESPATLDTQLQQMVAAPPDETPQASPAPDSQPVTAAPSPEPEAEPEVDTQQDVDQDLDADGVETEPENGPLEPEVVTKHPKKQYLFKKLPEIAAMEEALEDIEEADDKTLYQTLESGAKTLKAWQEEYLELKKITDDEDNAKRRAQNDKAIENWDTKQKLDDIPAFRRTFDDIVQKVPASFDVKGVRAPKPYVDDPVQEHQRQEDKIMAQTYGFDYKADKASIGKQDPIGQRWETSENRLRDRRQTQKAVDAAEDGVILEGKRTRKPRVLEDQSAPLSRATTPIPTTRQRQRKTMATATAEDLTEAAAEPVTRRRGPRGKAKIVAQGEAAPLVMNGVGEDAPQDEKLKVTRKRGRAAAPHPLATTTYAEPQEEQPAKKEPEPPFKRQRKTKETANTGPEIPAGSFYSQPHADEARRPSTSSSSGTATTAATVESSYSLRDKRKRNFAVENDPIAETRPKRAKPNPPATTEEKSQEAPKKKRVRNRKKAPATDENSAHGTPGPAPSGTASPAPLPGTMMHTFSAHPDPVPAPAPAKKALLKIKLVNGYNGHPAPGPAQGPRRPSAASSPAVTPTATDQPATNPGSASGSAEPPEKPYSEMSKSEKMSYSMRRKLLLSPLHVIPQGTLLTA